jgi:glycosyltransferase involved in cell wall biosynthesis
VTKSVAADRAHYDDGAEVGAVRHTRDGETAMVRAPFVTVVIPACNEEAIITANLERVVTYLRTIEDRYPWELIVINDGSRDRTGELIDEFATIHPHVRAFHHRVNFNLGQALCYAFNNARGDYVVTLDADLSYAPEHVGALLDAALAEQAKVVIASPYLKGGKTTAVPFLRRLLSRASNAFLSITAKGKLSTLSGMVRCYDRPFIQALSLKAQDAEINPEIIYKAQLMRARIVEIPAHLDWTAQRALGKRRRSNLKLMRSVAGQAFSSFLFRPFMFFVLPGLLVALLAAYTLGWVGWNVAQRYAELSGSFDPRFSQAVGDVFDHSPHAFIVGGIALLVAIQLISLGVLSAQSKRYFEELFHLGSLAYRQLRVPDVWPPVAPRPVDDSEAGSDLGPGAAGESPPPG